LGRAAAVCSKATAQRLNSGGERVAEARRRTEEEKDEEGRWKNNKVKGLSFLSRKRR
jgi:hypothetical protein